MNPLCLAIDTSDGSVVDSLARATRTYVGMFKVGATTFAAIPIRVRHRKKIQCRNKLWVDHERLLAQFCRSFVVVLYIPFLPCL